MNFERIARAGFKALGLALAVLLCVLLFADICHQRARTQALTEQNDLLRRVLHLRETQGPCAP